MSRESRPHRALWILALTLAGWIALVRPVSSEGDTGGTAHALPHVERIEHALEVLGRVPAGRKVIEKVEKKWAYHDEHELLAIFRWGKASRTDAVLTRYF